LVFDGEFAAFPSGVHSDGFEGRLLPHIVVIPTLDWYPYGDQGSNYNGSNSILRNSQILHQRGDCLVINSDNVLVENTEIGYCLGGTFHNQNDAHVIQLDHMKNVVLRNLDLHHGSGDCVQVGSDICDYAQVDRQWDNVLLEHSRLWTGPLPEDMPGFLEGQIPGENGFDTKTYMLVAGTPLSYCAEVGVDPEVFVNVRSHATLLNVEAFGWTPNRDIYDLTRGCVDGMDTTPSQYDPSGSVIVAHYNTDLVADSLYVHDNSNAFDVRGPYQSEAHGQATMLITNSLVYNHNPQNVLLPNPENTNCHMTCSGTCYSVQLSTGWSTSAFKIFAETENFRLYHNTFANNYQFMTHADYKRGDPSYYAFDDYTYVAENNLYLGASLPGELSNFGDNLAVSSSAFVNPNNGDYRLVSQLSASSPVSGVDYDIIGEERTSPVSYGAYEYV